MKERARYFFQLSGEHPELSFGELRAILFTFDSSPNVTLDCKNVGLAETTKDCAVMAVERSAYVKEAALLIVKSTDMRELIEYVRSAPLHDLLNDGETFEVRCVKCWGAEHDAKKAEAELGEIVLNCGKHVSVNLSNPDKRFVLLATPYGLFFGLSIARKRKKEFYDRKAGRRPFTLPSALQPNVARCMVNLARVKPGGRILDPFAGSASILIEAWLLGYESVGLEIKHWICRGARLNLERYAPEGPDIVNGDAMVIPFRKGFDAIVTDPPYGRSTTISTRSLNSLLEGFLSNATYLLAEGGRICMASPSDTDLISLGKTYGLEVLETYAIRVHGTLTRNITVFRMH
ncbi:MAG: RsmD family RNA methyltransferase [Nitrososphaerota archaeon]|nr:RsmD family RNA methyltransferase [Aigarchaeota archaeon]MDW8076843.1 RsmD family RNA methyltransferase [Nitrososphaerota archaeon]